MTVQADAHMPSQSDRSNSLSKALTQKLRAEYEADGGVEFAERISKQIAEGEIPTYVALEIGEMALDRRDSETVRCIVYELHRHGDESPLLVELDALSLLLVDKGQEALSVLSAGIAKWPRPYLTSLKDQIEKVLAKEKG